MSSTLILTHSQIEKLMPYSEFPTAIETVFREWGNGNVVMPPKIHLDMSRSGYDSWNNAMPGYVVPQGAAGIKWIGGYADNPKNGLPYIRGVVTLTEPKNGDTLAFMDGVYISDWRTGASAAVAIKYLARKGFKKVTIVGAGTQGKTAAACIHVFFPEVEITVADISEKNLASFKKVVKEKYGIDAKTSTDANEASKDADAIVLLTTANRPFLKKEALKPGVLLLGMGSYQQAFDDTLLSCDKVLVDSAGQAAHRGEIKELVESGKIPENSLTPELGEIVAGKATGRTSDDEKILIVLVGLGAHDVFCASEAYKRAKAAGIGTAIDLND